MDNIYNLIDNLCKQKKSNITAMCHEIGISRTALSELKSGRTRKLSSDNMMKIAKYLDTTVEYLSGEKEQKEKPAENGELRPIVKELMDIINTYDDERIKALLTVIRDKKNGK